MNRRFSNQPEWMVGVGMLVLVFAGCTPAPQRCNAPPQGHTPYQSELNENYVTMNDNAMLADMVMSPCHFVPHQSELNGLGARRLTRYAEILKVYGGTLNYDGMDDPQPLLNDRLQSIRDFLAGQGAGSDKVTVAQGMAGGSGMRGSEAMEIRNATTFTEEKAAGSGTGGGTPSQAPKTGGSTGMNTGSSSGASK